MEVHQIRYFLAVVSQRHFGRAATVSNVTQPALTRAIQKLEDELGGPLLIRRPNQIELTALGRQVLPHLEEAFKRTMVAKSEAKAFANRSKARLRVGVMCTIGPWMLADLFTRLNSHVQQLEVVLTEATGDRIVEGLLADDIDVAILGLPEYADALEVFPLFRERYVVAFPKGHRFEHMIEVPMREIENESYLERLNCEFVDFYEKNYGEWPFAMQVRYGSEREDWIQAMIVMGMGCAFLPANLPILPELQTRPICEPVIEREICVAHAVGATMPQPARAFIDLVRSSFDAKRRSDGAA